MSKLDEIINLIKTEIGYFKKLKTAMGDIHGHIHGLSVRLAHIHLSKKHRDVNEWVLSDKYGKGLDIIGKNIRGKVIVAGEVKTTFRSEKISLGSQQKNMIEKDVKRLIKSGAKYNYLIVIDKKNKDAIENIVNKNDLHNKIKLLNILEV